MNVEKTGVYTFARVVVGFLIHMVFGGKASGVENFPTDTHCILMANHISGWDPLTVAHFYKHNEIHFIGKEQLFRYAPLRWLLIKLHAFPVRRGESDMAAMRTAMQVLRDGHVLGIFPEGTRQRGETVKAIETGIAVLALKTDVPIIPIHISGKYRPFGKLRAAIGAPLELSDLRTRHADVETMDEVKRRIVKGMESLKPA